MIDARHAASTWYEETAARGPLRLSLAGRAEVDICVIGGGLAGLTAALDLARRGKRVRLLEAKRLAWGASGRNGGFVSNGFAEGLDEIAGRVGLEATRALFQLSRFGTEFVRREIAEGDPTIKMGDGWLSLRRYDSGASLKAYRDRLERDYGEKRDYLETEETRSRLASQRYFQSLYDPSAFHMHPLRYALMLAAKAEAAGAVLHENSPARDQSYDGAAWRIRTEQGEIRAPNVVYCVSALDRKLHPATGRAVLPVATYVAVTEPLRQDAIRTRSACADQRRANNYFRLVNDGRILWGGAITTRLSEPARLAAHMRDDMLATFPQLGSPAIASAWAGLMGYALHKMPLVGGDGQGQWWATAFGGHGMNTTAMAGLLIARAIAAGDDEYRRFAPFAPQWAGGPFGRFGVQASYWLMQAKDRWDETRPKAA
jgi:gamma-glutamylputrescine oxidase